MLRLALGVLLLFACAHPNVSTRPQNQRPKLPERVTPHQQQLIHLFGWTVRDANGVQHDVLETMNTQTRVSLERFTGADTTTSILMFNKQLKALAAALLVHGDTAEDVLSQQGQVKQHGDESLGGSSQAIRSITRSSKATSAQCYEMRKVFTEAQRFSSPSDKLVEESWRKFGISRSSETASPASGSNTKAFLYLSFPESVARLYVYEESTSAIERELTEIVIHCPLSDAIRLRSVE